MTLSISIHVNIRPMREEDIAQVHAIDKLSFNMPWPESSYRFELFDNDASFLWVAETNLPAGSQVIGMIVVWIIQDEAHIATIAVHSDYRKRGIGKLLLATALQAVIQRGASLATLEVRSLNKIAQKMYLDFGFSVVGNRPHYYRDNNDDALIMTVNGLDQHYYKWLNEQFSGSGSDQGRVTEARYIKGLLVL